MSRTKKAVLAQAFQDFIKDYKLLSHAEANEALGVGKNNREVLPKLVEGKRVRMFLALRPGEPEPTVKKNIRRKYHPEDIKRAVLYGPAPTPAEWATWERAVADVIAKAEKNYASEMKRIATRERRANPTGANPTGETKLELVPRQQELPDPLVEIQARLDEMDKTIDAAGAKLTEIETMIRDLHRCWCADKKEAS
jgi:hypothetical protein